MKCQHCLRAINRWQPFCPHCRNRMQPNSYSTITEATETLEQHARRRLLRKVLQFSLVAVTLIAIASFIRFNPPKADPLPQENLRPAVHSSPSPAPTPLTRLEVAAVAPIESAPIPAPMPVLEAQPLSLFSAEDFRPETRRATPVAVTRPVVSPPVAVAVEPKKAHPASTSASADEAPPKKVATPIATSVSVPPAPSTTLSPEAEPKLEVEAAGVLLHPNTGLVTIKSYVPARVYIDGVYSGSTPRSVKLLAGEHTISLLAEGYHDYSRKVKVSGQQQLGILASMSKK